MLAGTSRHGADAASEEAAALARRVAVEVIDQRVPHQLVGGQSRVVDCDRRGLPPGAGVARVVARVEPEYLVDVVTQSRDGLLGRVAVVVGTARARGSHRGVGGTVELDSLSILLEPAVFRRHVVARI